MGAPTSATFENNPGPIQRLQGYITPTGTLANDTYSFPANNPNIVLTGGVLTITCGFIPLHVELINTDTGACVSQEWYKGMAANNYLEYDSGGIASLQTDGATAGFNVTTTAGSRGSISQSGGTAPPAARGVVTIFTDIILASSNLATWIIDG